MGVLSNIEPYGVFRFFEEICGIPHGSSDTKRISDYLVKFATDRDLRYIQDDSNNVIIFKDGTAGYEDSASVMLQGHMDMVCEKDTDCDIDFEHDGLRLLLEDGVISADGTTLGGDDGIAVAFALAILDNPELYATHEYIANRISRVTSKDVYAFFKSVLANGDPGYEKIANIAEKYVAAYDKQKDNK